MKAIFSPDSGIPECNTIPTTSKCFFHAGFLVKGCRVWVLAAYCSITGSQIGDTIPESFFSALLNVMKTSYQLHGQHRIQPGIRIFKLRALNQKL